MEEEKVYCPACNHEVRLVATPDHRDGQANLPAAAEIVCLDFGTGCADARCPLTHVSGRVMGVRLVRSGLGESPRTISAICDACNQAAELNVVDPLYAVCPLCGVTHRWVLLEAGEGKAVAVTLP